MLIADDITTLVPLQTVELVVLIDTVGVTAALIVIARLLDVAVVVLMHDEEEVSTALNTSPLATPEAA